jgi:hypothetical protein
VDVVASNTFTARGYLFPQPDAANAARASNAAHGYDVLGFGVAYGGAEVFQQLVLARIIEHHRHPESARAGCGHVDRLDAWPDRRRRDRSSRFERARCAPAAL